jgi:hypothetical protein
LEIVHLLRQGHHGRRGRINARELHEQMNSCSYLMLILACVIYWQAREISRLVRCRGPEDAAIDVGMPLCWGRWNDPSGRQPGLT